MIDLYFFLFAVNALIDIKKSLIDPKNNLKNWNKGDPCARNWTGVWCFDKKGEDGYFHIREMYEFFFPSIFFLFLISMLLFRYSKFTFEGLLNFDCFVLSNFTEAT